MFLDTNNFISNSLIFFLSYRPLFFFFLFFQCVLRSSVFALLHSIVTAECVGDNRKLERKIWRCFLLGGLSEKRKATSTVPGTHSWDFRETHFLNAAVALSAAAAAAPSSGSTAAAGPLLVGGEISAYRGRLRPVEALHGSRVPQGGGQETPGKPADGTVVPAAVFVDLGATCVLSCECLPLLLRCGSWFLARVWEARLEDISNNKNHS